jgi:hypothetical protein
MRKLFVIIAFAVAIVSLPTFAWANEPRPPGVSRLIGFTVAPVYPKSYDIAAVAQHSFLGHCSVEELKTAWQKKAVMVAKGHKFKVTKLVVHDAEDDLAVGWPMKTRSVSGTITLTN